MKEIEIKAELPYQHSRIRPFFLFPSALRLFYEIKRIEFAGNLTWLINRKYKAILLVNSSITWEIYEKQKDLKDRVRVTLLPYGDSTYVHIHFETNRLLPLKKVLEEEVNNKIELLTDLLKSLRKW
ncbi:hypothetical protein [Metallosphaera sp.]|uniref:hypothetical protein n=1 Tax=Metallosphaera sp. TaxID=2020860 RepID=UPI00317612FB